MHSLRLVAVALVVFALVSTSVWAQSSTTSLRGMVSDPVGAVLPGAKVTISNPQTGFSRTARLTTRARTSSCSATGDLRANRERGGFCHPRRTAHRAVSQHARHRECDHEGSRGGRKGGGDGRDHPGQHSGRNLRARFWHGADCEPALRRPRSHRHPSLQAGVVYTGNSSHISSASDSRSGSVSGARSDQTNVTLDGADNNDQLLGTAFQGALRVPLDSLQEFKVTTSNSDAETGRSSGGQVSLVTKSGTNGIHGAVYEYNRTNFGNANDWFNEAAQISAGLSNRPGLLIRNTFGAFLGGPIKKDRLFYFLAYEGQRKHENQQVTRVVPSVNLRNGIMQYLCQQGDPTCPAGGVETLTAADLASMDPYCSANGTCPLGPGPNPAVMQVFQQYPVPNTGTVGDGFDYQGFTFSSPLPQKLDAYVGKIDYNLTANGNHRVFLRGVLNNDRAAQSAIKQHHWGWRLPVSWPANG